MDREELLSHHDELCKMAKQLMEKKNHDYAGQEETNRLQTLPELRRWAFAQPSRDFWSEW